MATYVKLVILVYGYTKQSKSPNFKEDKYSFALKDTCLELGNAPTRICKSI